MFKIASNLIAIALLYIRENTPDCIAIFFWFIGFYTLFCILAVSLGF